MENASKALIIAGAILLAIVIISIGLLVTNQARDTINKVNMSQQEIETFNNKFVAYQGEKVSGTQVKALLQMVISVNGSEKQNGTYHYVEMTVNGTKIVEKNGDQDYKVASNSGVTSIGYTYTVSLHNSETTGLVDSVTVTKQSN